MGSSTSVGRGPAHGNNENHDGDPTHHTMGEGASQDDPPVGSDVPGDAFRDDRAGLPAGRAPQPAADAATPDAGRAQPDAAKNGRRDDDR